jgi:hypothetical protein
VSIVLHGLSLWQLSRSERGSQVATWLAIAVPLLAWYLRRAAGWGVCSVPMNETAHAVACGNGQQRSSKIIAVNGM